MKLTLIRKHAFRIIACLLGLCILTVTALFIISGGNMKQQYLKPWSKEYSNQFSDPRVQVAAVGLLAANNHNMQPWKLVLDKSDPKTFYLYADSSRVTKEVDPYARQLMISQGTFLEYAAIAGEEKGWHVSISLFPDGTYDESNLYHDMDRKPVAKITLMKAQPVKNPLYSSMFLPDTNRSAYEPTGLTADQTATLKGLSSTSGLSVKIYKEKDDVAMIGDYALQSAPIEAFVSRIMEESSAIFRASEREKNKYRYGYSVEGQGTSGFMKHILQGLLTVFPAMNAGESASQNFIRSTQVSVNNTHAYAMIITPGNSRIEQVESGMLYSRLILTGHHLGLAMQPLSQVLEEYPEMDSLYSEFHECYGPDGSTIQMLFRVGVPKKNAVHTMRQDVQSLIFP